MRKFPVHVVRAAAMAVVTATALSALNAQTRPSSQPTTQASIQASTQPSTQHAVNVDQLIQQLGSDNPQHRDKAQTQLVNLGLAVVPALKKAAAEDEDPEVRSRAAAAISQMKDRDANEVSLITLHRKDAAAGDVLDDIAAQSHAKFLGYGPGQNVGNNNRTVSIDADGKPFWEVMTDVCTQLNVCPVLDTPGKNSLRLFVAPRNWISQSPHQIVGPYWVGVTGMYRTRTIDLTGPPLTDDQFQIRMIVFPEPKLAVTQMSEFNLKEATDDAGNSLLPPAQPMGFGHMLRNTRQMNHTIECRLAYPKNAGKKISLLRGDVVVMLAQDIQQFQIDDVLGTPKTTNPLTNCTIQANVARQGNDIFRVTIQCTRQGLTDEQWSAMINRMNELTLEDADGHALSSLTAAISGPATETTFSANAIFSRTIIGAAVVNRPGNGKVGEPKRLTWNVATSLKSVTVPVTFRDLPMP